jgi:hypothetical protein
MISTNNGKTGLAIDGDNDQSESRTSNAIALTRCVSPSNKAHRSSAATRQAESEWLSGVSGDWMSNHKASAIDARSPEPA